MVLGGSAAGEVPAKISSPEVPAPTCLICGEIANDCVKPNCCEAAGCRDCFKEIAKKQRDEGGRKDSKSGEIWTFAVFECPACRGEWSYLRDNSGDFVSPLHRTRNLQDFKESMSHKFERAGNLAPKRRAPSAAAPEPAKKAAATEPAKKAAAFALPEPTKKAAAPEPEKPAVYWSPSTPTPKVALNSAMISSAMISPVPDTPETVAIETPKPAASKPVASKPAEPKPAAAPNKGSVIVVRAVPHIQVLQLTKENTDKEVFLLPDGSRLDARETPSISVRYIKEISPNTEERYFLAATKHKFFSNTDWPLMELTWNGRIYFTPLFCDKKFRCYARDFAAVLGPSLWGGVRPKAVICCPPDEDALVALWTYSARTAE